MTLSVTIYFPAHCGHTGWPDWGDVPQGRLWVESRPRRLRPCGPVRSCGPVPFAVTALVCDILGTFYVPWPGRFLSLTYSAVGKAGYW